MRFLSIFFLVSLIQSDAFGINYKDHEISVQPKALVWTQARSLCLELGPDWDLPTVQDIQEQRIPSSKLTSVDYVDLRTQDQLSYYLIWARSNEDQLNSQFIQSSQALWLNPESGEIDSYSLSSTKVEQLSVYLDESIVSADLISRSDSDHDVLMAFLEVYHSSDLGRRYPIDPDLPLFEQPDYVFMLPTTVVSPLIFSLLSKPSRRYVDTTIQNLKLELETISDGLDVICVQAHRF